MNNKRGPSFTVVQNRPRAKDSTYVLGGLLMEADIRVSYSSTTGVTFFAISVSTVQNRQDIAEKRDLSHPARACLPRRAYQAYSLLQGAQDETVLAELSCQESPIQVDSQKPLRYQLWCHWRRLLHHDEGRSVRMAARRTC